MFNDAILAFSGASALLAATDVVAMPSTAERYGALGLLAVVLWWVMNRQTKAIDDNTQAIRDLQAKLDRDRP